MGAVKKQDKLKKKKKKKEGRKLTHSLKHEEVEEEAKEGAPQARSEPATLDSGGSPVDSSSDYKDESEDGDPRNLVVGGESKSGESDSQEHNVHGFLMEYNW